MMITKDFVQYRPLPEDMFVLLSIPNTNVVFYHKWARRRQRSDVVGPFFGFFPKEETAVISAIKVKLDLTSIHVITSDLLINSMRLKFHGFAFENEADAVVFSEACRTTSFIRIFEFTSLLQVDGKYIETMGFRMAAGLVGAIGKPF